MSRFTPIVVCMVFSGCMSIGNQQIENKDVVAQIKAGTSNKEDVKRLVGEPGKITSTDNSEEIWDYTLSQMQMRPSSLIPVVGWFTGGSDMQVYTLTVRFRQDGIVKEVGSGKTTGGGGNLLGK